MLILSSFSAELENDLFRMLEILPGSLRANVDTAERVAGPAVLVRIEEVVRVHVSSLLQTVVAFTIEPVLGLETRGNLTASEVVEESETKEPGECKALKVKIIIS